jgi:hypothetical protein
MCEAMMKRAPSILCVLTLLVPGVAASSHELPPGGTFTDDDGSVHEPAIEALVAAGITIGCAPGLFCPDDPVTRGQKSAAPPEPDHRP